MPPEETPFDDLLETLKKVTGLLRDADIPFLLGGGLAVWARGGPETVHDIDLMLTPPDAERGLEVLGSAGLRTERPPEGWLYKAFDGDVLVDLIFGPSGQPIEDTVFDRAEELNVYAVPMQVMALEDVMATKLEAASPAHRSRRWRVPAAALGVAVAITPFVFAWLVNLVLLARRLRG